jgi:phage recombination protein Bet
MMSAPAPLPAVQQAPQSLVAKFAQRYTVEAGKLLTTLKATAFRVDGAEITTEQMMALLIVADQYHLNPFTKEIFAFTDKHKGVVPVVSVDGWARIVNEHDQFNGVEFEYGPPSSGGKHHEWIDCIMYRKDRDKPVRAREFWGEVSRESGPWKSHPNRMHRHKAYIQCARLAFGFAGIYDEDEAERIIEINPATNEPEPQPQAQPQTRTASVAAKVRDKQAKAAAAVVDAEVVENPVHPSEAPTGEDPPAAAGGLPPVEWTLEKALKYVEDAKTADHADLVLDQSRGQLSKEDYATLVTARNGKWSELVQ